MASPPDEDISPPEQDIPLGSAPRTPYLEPYLPWQGEGGGMIAAGEDHSVVLRVDGTVFTFGNGLQGQLGTGRPMEADRPVQIRGLPPALSVAAGPLRTAIVTTNGQVLVCGIQLLNELPRYNPVPQIIPGLDDVIGVACGNNFIVAIRRDGTAMGLGRSQEGQLGVFEDQTALRQIEGIADARAVAAGSNHCIYLFNDETVGTMGSNYFGQLGDGRRGRRSSDLVRLPELRGVVCISAGPTYCAVVTRDGRVATWGAGNLGHDAWGDEPRPRFIKGINDAFAVSCGGHNHSAIVHQDGGVSTFGVGTDENDEEVERSGWLGHGDDVGEKIRPTRVEEITGAIAVSCGNNHTIVQHADGWVSTFGIPDNGRLGRLEGRPDMPGFINLR
jgi:alpha-tubulin suppressor-like RCC1 family protein